MAHHQRAPLQGVFGDVPRTRSTSPSKRPSGIFNILKTSIRDAGFPYWKTLRGLSTVVAQPCDFTLRMSTNYRYYAADQEPHNVFQRSATIIQELRNTFAIQDNEKFLEVYSEFTEDAMAHLVFGSNMQERAGMGLDETMKICRRIFRGEDVNASDVDPRSPEYVAQLKLLVQHGVENPELTHVIRSRREVIQHAKALKHITECALNRDQPLLERMICETHRILCDGIALGYKQDGDPVYAGLYRDINVAAGGTLFCDHNMVPGRMMRFCADFNEDVEQRETNQDLDPFYLAADLCQDFVTIHPFKDGNGRMCRLLANAFLIKYAGIMISIGEDEKDREDYLKIAMAAGDYRTEEQARGTLAGFFLEKADRTLRRLKGKVSALKQ